MHSSSTFSRSIMARKLISVFAALALVISCCLPAASAFAGTGTSRTDGTTLAKMGNGDWRWMSPDGCIVDVSVSPASTVPGHAANVFRTVRASVSYRTGAVGTTGLAVNGRSMSYVSSEATAAVYVDPADAGFKSLSVPVQVAPIGEPTFEFSVTLDMTRGLDVISEHAWGEWVTDKAATSSQEGSRHRACTMTDILGKPCAAIEEEPIAKELPRIIVSNDGLKSAHPGEEVSWVVILDNCDEPGSDAFVAYISDASVLADDTTRLTFDGTELVSVRQFMPLLANSTSELVVTYKVPEGEVGPVYDIPLVLSDANSADSATTTLRYVLSFDEVAPVPPAVGGEGTEEPAPEGPAVAPLPTVIPQPAIAPDNALAAQVTLAPAAPAPAQAVIAQAPAPAQAPAADGTDAAQAAGGAMSEIADEPAPLAEIADDETPLGTFDEPHCWTHNAMLAGCLLTAAYGIAVARRRKLYADDLREFEDKVSGLAPVEKVASAEEAAAVA